MTDGHRVSILVPFRAEAGEPGRIRTKNWRWLRKRWKAVFPQAEIVTGTDNGTPFSKTVAVNHAYSKARGDVFIIADADSWVEMDQILRGLRYAVDKQVLVVPWHEAHRLTSSDSDELVLMDPAIEQPVTGSMRLNVTDYRPAPSTAAMVVIITRESFERVGGMDPRFRGWGAEDVGFGLACETLLGQTKLMLGEAFALFHERPRKDGLRVWEGDSGHHNIELGERYWTSRSRTEDMLALCAEHPLLGAKTPISTGPSLALLPPRTFVPEFRDAVERQDFDRGSVVESFDRAYGATLEGEVIEV